MANSNIQFDPSCMDDYDPDSLPADVAIAKIQAAIKPVIGFETLALRSALGRILYMDIESSINVPGYTNSAMDGYALSGQALPSDGEKPFRVVGASWAGRPCLQAPADNECVRIMTGAVMPPCTDTVIMQEHVKLTGDTAFINSGHKTGQNVRRAGEDVTAGQTVLHAGVRVTPAVIGLLASLGIGEVKVRRKLRVAFFSTGDELRSLGEPLEAGQIYDSNRYTLFGMLTRLGIEIIDMGVVRDTREDVVRAFNDAADCADVITTTGGVSVGEADFVKETLEKIGKVGFWKVAMKPGRPLAFGSVKNAWFFGLPGNPVSAMVTFYIFVQPALRLLSGEQPSKAIQLTATCRSALHKSPGRVEYQRGVYQSDGRGFYEVRKTGAQGSGILSSMAEANCLIVLPLECSGVKEGETVSIMPLECII